MQNPSAARQDRQLVVFSKDPDASREPTGQARPSASVAAAHRGHCMTGPRLQNLILHPERLNHMGGTVIIRLADFDEKLLQGRGHHAVSGEAFTFGRDLRLQPLIGALSTG